MSKKLTFIEEAEIKGYLYRPLGILGNGFYGNGLFISLAEMEKLSKTGGVSADKLLGDDPQRINPEFFIKSEEKEIFHTNDILALYPDLKKHDFHNFLNRFKDVFLSQKLFTVVNRKRVFSKEAVNFIYSKLIKKEEENTKKRGRKVGKSENN